MKILVACEYSGTVRDAFTRLGHDAWSCDIIPTESPGNHIQADVLTVLDQGWDLMIAHPPCTHLATSGARWFKDKGVAQEEALAFVTALLNAPIAKIALENPVSIISTKIRKPDQIIQPWQFGHREQKTTCLWLKNLPKLVPTEIIPAELIDKKWMSNMSKKNRGHNRSATFSGIAEAMAKQWGMSLS